jgi:hypothetical protein
MAMGHTRSRANRDDNDPSAPSLANRSYDEAGVAVAERSRTEDLRRLLERDGILIVDTGPFSTSSRTSSS